MSRSLAKVIIYEKSGRWAAALRGVWPGWQRSLVETRSLPDLWRELSAAPSSLLLLEATTVNGLSVAKCVSDVQRTFPAAQMAVLVERALCEIVWPLRELGAIHAVVATRNVAQLVPLIEQQLKLHEVPGSVPVREILDQLPWA